jgi:hypothetical protein
MTFVYRAVEVLDGAIVLAFVVVGIAAIVEGQGGIRVFAGRRPRRNPDLERVSLYVIILRFL